MKAIKFLSVVFTVVAIIASSASFAMSAKDKTAEKLAQERADSIDASKALKAIQGKNFVLMADRLEVNGHVEFVSDNMNFFATNGENAMLQLAPQPAYFDGINLKGRVTKAEVRTDKHGNTLITYDVFGSTLNATVMITMFHDSNKAQATVVPTFFSGDITLNGQIFDVSAFNTLEGALQ